MPLRRRLSSAPGRAPRTLRARLAAAEKALRHSEHMYRTLFDSIDAGFCIIEVLFDGDERPVDYRFLEVNPAFAQQTGIVKAVGRTMREIAPQHEAHWFELYGRIALTGEPLRFENPAEALGRFYDVYAFRVGVPEERRVAVLFNDITARKTDAESLRRSERTFRTLYESMRDAFVVVDMSGRIRQYNRSFQELLGYSDDELAQLTYQDITPVQWHAEEARMIEEEVLTQGYSPVYEKEYRRKDGSIVPIELRAVLIHDDQGQPAGLWGIIRDITERKQAEKQLLELNQTLEARVAQRSAEVQDLYDHAPVGYHSLDPAGRMVRVNQTELDWLGYSRAELIGCPATMLLAPSSQATLQANFQLLQQQGWLHGIELEMRRKDGSIFPALVNATAIYDDAGAFVMTRSTMVDISERKQAEAALRTSEERLRLSEARLQLLLSKTPAVIFSSLAEGDFHSTFISESVSTVLGYTPEQFLSGPGFWAQRIHPEDKARVFGDAAQLFAQGWRQYEYRCRHADGSYRWMETGVSLLPAVAGHPAEVVGYMIDITPRKQAEALLRHANAELARAARDKDAFLANMSHELRTPLNAILGFSEILCAEIRGPLNPSQQDALHNIETSGQHLLAMINDILDLAKVESGRLDLQPERIGIAEICEASLLFVKELALKKSLYIDIRLSDPLAQMQADPKRLKQMLVNLLSNAVKFTPSGGQVTLDVGVDAQAGLVRFSVQDSGIGIAPEDLGRLFQPFSQVDSLLSRQQAGSGLGLALVRRLAELHGGKVRVESALGVGSCFTITLPIHQPERGATSLALEAPAKPMEESGAAGTRVLLTDDHEANLLMIVEYLQSRGYAVEVARTGQEALACIAAVDPAVILMDIQLPDLDGLEVIRRLRAQPAWATTPIIALTALAMPGDRERCLVAGASAYLTKPVSLRDLVATIEQLMRA